MGSDLVLTHPSVLSSARSRAAGAVAAAALLVLVAVLSGGAGLYLAACVLVGLGLTCLSGLPLTTEERLAFGAVVGPLAVALSGLLLAEVFGLTAVTVLVGLSAPAVPALAAAWSHRARLGRELEEAAERWARRVPWPLWLLLAACWSFTLVLLAQAYSIDPQGIVAGNPSSYADWAAHLTYAGSFAYGANFPPAFPIEPGHPLSYPFLLDFLAAELVPLGSSLTSSLVLTSGLLALAFPAVMYLAGVRLLASRGGAALAVLVFLLSGGIGFVFFFSDLLRLGPSAMQHLPRLYTQDVGHNYQWLNPVLAWMLPQRSVLFGFSLALIVLTLLWIAIHQAERPGWGPFLFAGVVAGLTPLAHLHAYGTVVALVAFWTVFTPRRQWLGYFVPALVLGLPMVVWLLSGGAAHARLQPWWLADTGGNHDGPIWFWTKNTGLLVPLMALAFVWRGLLPPGLSLHLGPIWLWFLVPNFVVFQPWDWDNTKFFAYWALLGALPVGALLARLLGGGLGPGAVSVLLGAALAVSLTLAGTLDLARTLDRSVSSGTFTDSGGIQVADWVRTHTPPRAIFLVGTEHNQPVPTLGGRAVVAGYPGWLWTYGLADWPQRTRDVDTMLSGGPGTPELVRAYGVDYVVIGPQEVNGHHANQAYWDAHAQVVYSSGEYTVYRVAR